MGEGNGKRAKGEQGQPKRQEEYREKREKDEGIIKREGKGRWKK
jgi:hypothetical protein